jgi:hypothetical protein
LALAFRLGRKKRVSDDERSYFRRRAEIEIEAAQAARHPEAVRAHYLLAGYYLDLAFNPAPTANPCMQG